MERPVVIALHYQNDVLHPEGRIKVGMDEDGAALGIGAARRDRRIREQNNLLARLCPAQTVPAGITRRGIDCDAGMIARPLSRPGVRRRRDFRRQRHDSKV